ncbi:Zn-dependent hydrolase [Clostridium polynesiense]|uniref:Zn-dependent hydrolase n=1 Tax=Clostridium polynesiense TaxID=1325933 RepID=UPI00058C3F5A|nr:Zn-dependent hydrolase [Clostridium polynesiense]
MKINLDRVIKDIETLATFTATPGNGVTRLSYTKEDRAAREYLISEMKKIGLKVWEDGFSNLFGRREGKNPEAPVILIGSHYDSVTNGGAFDGVAGVVAALEVLRVFEENNIENYYPIEIIAMNAEEGHRFGVGTGVANSRALIGRFVEEELDLAKDKNGISKRQAMIEYGFTPDLESAKRPEGSIKTFIELHVEQGPILDNNKKEIGLVEDFPGIGRYKVKFQGELKATTAPMDIRKDALVAASKFVLAVNKILKEIGGGITGNVGELTISPNSHQFVPEFAEASVEVRVFDDKVLSEVNLYEEFKKEIEAIEEETKVKIELSEVARRGYSNPTPPSHMSAKNNEIAKKICDELGYSCMVLKEGTGHDAMMMSEFIPTNMIFVPSKRGGITHHPDEWTEYEDLKKGIDVLLYSVKELSSSEEMQQD